MNLILILKKIMSNLGYKLGVKKFLLDKYWNFRSSKIFVSVAQILYSKFVPCFSLDQPADAFSQEPYLIFNFQPSDFLQESYLISARSSNLSKSNVVKFLS